MSFDTYKCEQYIKQITEYTKLEKEIYLLITSTLYPKSVLARQINLSFHTFNYKLKTYTLTTNEKISLLKFLK